MQTPEIRLALALQRDPLSPQEIAALKDRMGIAGGAGRILGALRQARPVSVDTYLAAHAVKGWDPLTSRPADKGAPQAGGAILWWFFGAGLALSRMTGRMTHREAAKIARVSLATWNRAENAHPVGPQNFLRLCAFMDRHPWQVCAPMPTAPAEGFTGNLHCNTLNSHISSHVTPV